MNRRFCVAPMMGRTDRHERFFLRKLSSHAMLYTEMIHSNAILNTRKEDMLNFHNSELPLAVQIAGCNPIELAEVSKKCEFVGYKEINLNIGCPSNQVQKGNFGAILMKDPDLVAKCIESIKDKVKIPVTVKCRIGVDNMDENSELTLFIEKLSDHGCNTFIIHARKALLNGLSPKQNRNIPPLNYARVYELKSQFPHLEIILNGGIETVESGLKHINYVDGIMMGRSIYSDPYQISKVDNLFYGKKRFLKSRQEVFKSLIPYLTEQHHQGVNVKLIIRHIMGLFKGTRNASISRRILSSDILDNQLEDNLKIIANKLSVAC